VKPGNAFGFMDMISLSRRNSEIHIH